MPSDNPQRDRHIQRLARYHREMADTLESAAGKTQIEDYDQLFREYSQQHADFADELEEHATTLEGRDGQLEDVSLPQLYREIGELEENVSESDLDAMIAESKRIEDELLEQYEESIEAAGGASELRDRISEQFSTLQESRRELRGR
ncbi:MAG: hypothetical protein ACLFVJ_04710 [Persicimonas sp.]